MPTNHQGKCSPTFLGVKVVAKMSASVVVVSKSLDKAESTDVTLKIVTKMITESGILVNRH